MNIKIKKDYWSDGNIYSEYSYLDGLLHGTQKKYHPNGNPYKIFNIKKRKLLSIQIFYENRTRECIQQFKNGPKIKFRYKYIKP